MLLDTNNVPSIFEDNGRLTDSQIRARLSISSEKALLAIELGMPNHAEMYAETAAHYARSANPELTA